ncbi:aldo/keto reductase [soil metagenome]
MITRVLGSSGIEVGTVGYGAMPLNWEYGTPVGDEEAAAVVGRALDSGVTLLDTADCYGRNEELLGQALRGRREEAVLSTKVGLVVSSEDPLTYKNDARPSHIRSSCDRSLRRLGVDVIDLYQLHRVDPSVPVEESLGAMAELVADGKVRALGLSEVDVSTLERAMAVHPIASVQSELSLWTRQPLEEVVPWCDTHDVAFLPYSPLGRGYLTGQLESADLDSADFRSQLPRFSSEAMEANRAIVAGIAAVAVRHEATNAQVALAWLLAQSERVIPIPGTKTVRYVEENAKAADLRLTADDLDALEALPSPVGGRYGSM